MKGSFLALVAAIFALTMPLYADPGGSHQASLQSSTIISSDIVGIETAALRPAAGIFDATAVSKFIKSAVTPVAGGVVALLGGGLLAVMFAPLMNHLPMFKRRDRNYNLVSIGLANRTKSPLLKMRAAS